jgi:hypothetical protein
MAIPAAALFLVFRFVMEAFGGRLHEAGGFGVLVWILEDFMAKFGPGLLAIGMVVNQRGAIYEMGRGFAPLLPWRKDAREEQREERDAKRDPEIGELGITDDFTSEAVVALDHRLGIVDDVTPPEGYVHGTVEPEVSADV